MPGSSLNALFKEPLLHFIAIGAALFVWFQWSGGGAGPGSTRIAITSGQIEFTLRKLYNERTNKGLLVHHKLKEAQKEVWECRDRAAMGNPISTTRKFRKG